MGCSPCTGGYGMGPVGVGTCELPSGPEHYLNPLKPPIVLVLAPDMIFYESSWFGGFDRLGQLPPDFAPPAGEGLVSVPLPGEILLPAVKPGLAGSILASRPVTPTSATIRFGNNPNQTYHTFRHVVAAGMDQGTVQAAVQADLAANATAINAGLNVRTLTVGGQQVTYHAFKLPDGVINVGRITLP